MNKPFRDKQGEDIFNRKYRHDGCETWKDLSRTLVEDVCEFNVDEDTKDSITEMIASMKFIPGGRYLYYAGRPNKYFNNCYLLKAEEDTKEDWANLSWKSEMCLMTGGGIGVDYSVYRPSGATIKQSGGTATGPIAKMQMINELGRGVMQGGSRRSAIYASLNWAHGDADNFLKAKDWHDMKAGDHTTYAQLKRQDFNFPCPLDMTNISLNYDTVWLENYWKTSDPGKTFIENCRKALTTGEPGFSFNFFDKENETLRNACCEVTSADDSDVCNLGSLNLSRIKDLDDMAVCTELATIFLMCGTLKAHLPYEQVKTVREKNRRLGLGLMGVHEWLIQRGFKYEVTPELHKWLSVYRGVSNSVSKTFATKLNISIPVANRAIAPTGSIAMLADTTSGIEPIYATAYIRRTLKGNKWVEAYKIDHVSKQLIDTYGVDPNSISTAHDLAGEYETRIKFQADIQDYVDMAISSTINLPVVPTGGLSNEYVSNFANILARYAHRLRGITCYPDGARGGQPITKVDYSEALAKTKEENIEFNDACDIRGGGHCGT
jgi:ribonucleoside-diphosphate reductase alpha chain